MVISSNSTAEPDYGTLSTPGTYDDALSCGYDRGGGFDNSWQARLENRCAKKIFRLCCGLMMFMLIVAKACIPTNSISTLSEAPLAIVSSVNVLAEYQSASCDCIHDENAPCKSLMLLRHAKSSWKNSYFVDDIDRHLSTEGIAVAHNVGKSLHRMSVKLPDLILSSPSIRTEETLNIVLGEWILGADAHDHQKAKKLNVKVLSRQQHKKLNKKLKEKRIGVQYVDALYTLADSGYLPHLASMIDHSSPDNEPNRILIVGHNPAMEKILNEITSAQQHFAPGHLHDICFPGLKVWNDLELQKAGGVPSLVFP